MKSLYSLSDHVSSLSAKAVETFAHSFRGNTVGLGKRHVAAVKTKLSISNPLSFATRGSDPDSSLSLGVNDLQSPLCLELDDIAIGNRFTSPWINNMHNIILKNQFGSNPYQISTAAQNNAHQQLNSSLSRILKDKETVGSKEKKQNKRSASPYEITFGAKGLRHLPIIAGERQ